MPAAGPPSSCFGSSNRRATPGAIAASPPIPAAFRQAQGLPPRRQGRRQTLPVVAEPTVPALTPRRATWMVLRRPEQRTADEAQQLAQVRAQSAAVAEAIDLAEAFTTLVRQRQPAQLDPWLQRAASSTLEALAPLRHRAV